MQVHRFRHAAAIALEGKGETRYMTPEQAEIAGRALLAVAASIRSERFAESRDLTVRFDTTPSAHYVAEFERDYSAVKLGREAAQRGEPLMPWAGRPFPYDSESGRAFRSGYEMESNHAID